MAEAQLRPIRFRYLWYCSFGFKLSLDHLIQDCSWAVPTSHEFECGLRVALVSRSLENGNQFFRTSSFPVHFPFLSSWSSLSFFAPKSVSKKALFQRAFIVSHVVFFRMKYLMALSIGALIMFFWFLSTIARRCGGGDV
jgi:hypothetical protein